MPGFISENIYLFVQLSSLQNETRAITVNESFIIATFIDIKLHNIRVNSIRVNMLKVYAHLNYC